MSKRSISRSNSSSGDNSQAAKPNASVRRVRRSRRKMIPSELIILTSLAPNESHPLSDLDHLEREERRITAIASVLAETAKRRAEGDIDKTGGTK